MQKFIAEAKSVIHEKRLQRNGPEIAALILEIVPALEENRVDDEIKAKITNLTEFADDVSDRLPNTSFVHSCNVLSSIAASLHGGNTNDRGIALPTPLSNAINITFNPDPEATEFAY